jgi:hypothetical protein
MASMNALKTSFVTSEEAVMRFETPPIPLKKLKELSKLRVVMTQYDF